MQQPGNNKGVIQGALARRVRRGWIVGAVAIALFSAPLFLGTDVTVSGVGSFHVPGEYPTIQAAVDAAGDGDVVLVAPGVYNESVVIGGKSVTVASEFFTTGDPGRIDSTVIDGGGGAFVVRVTPTAGPATTIVGFTIRDADDGVVGEGSFSFLNNRVHGTADGIDYQFNAAGSPSGGLVRDSVFELNGDDGIDLDDDVSVIIENNIIRDNGDDGIEIRLHDYAGPTLDIVIRDNVITGNGEDGIQLIDYAGLSDRTIRIERNLLANNVDAGIGMMPNGETVENFGGAPLVEPVDVINNTIVGNDHGITGGDNTVLVNNIIANNAVGLKRLRIDSTVAFTLFFGNTTNSTDAIIASTSTLFVDPVFNPDYTLDPGSPAIDAGTASFSWNGNLILNLTPGDYIGPALDLGAYEFDDGSAVNIFIDDDGSIFEKDIEWLFAEGITFGCPGAGPIYCPNNSVSRAQMASFLVRAFDLPAVTGNRFSDVAGVHTANINALAEADITLGCNPGGTLYCPTEPVTRAQMGSFLARALELTPIPGDVFDDVAGIHEDNINAIAALEITKGCNPGGTLFCPTNPVTRGQMAAFLHRALG